MSKIAKWLLLLTFLLLLASTFAGCGSSPIKEGAVSRNTVTVDHPLRPTLSFLETAAAGQNNLASPTGAPPSVPQTGLERDPLQETPTPPPALESPLDPGALAGPTIPASQEPFPPQPSSTQVCATHDASVQLTASKTTLKVGEAVTIRVTLLNSGCVSLGLPQYRLAVLNSEARAILSPDKPEPVIHSLGVNPGKTDEAVFTLQAASPGKATLSALASFEVHLGYPGPAYWGASSSKELVLQVEK
jgi:hypothetical protein